MPEQEIEQQEQEQVEQPQEQPAVDPNIIAQAKLFGWKESYDGANKLSPEDYVKRAYERLDIAKGTIKTIERTNADLKAQNEQLAGKLENFTNYFKDFVKMSTAKQQQEYERGKREIEARMEQAVEDSDTGAFKKAKADLDMLEAQIKEHPALTGKEVEEVRTLPQTQEMDWYKANPEKYQKTQEAWIEENSWYESEIDMAMYADGVDRALAKSKVGKSHKSQQERLDAITAAVKKKFPEYFGEKPVAAAQTNGDGRRRTAAVEGGGGEGPPAGGGKKTYADLPREAKAVCDQLVKEKILTKEQYVNTYQWE